VTGGACSGSDPVNVILSIPADLVLQNITVAGGQTNCYNATQTIAVAGSGTTFEVQANASVTMIAGQKINYLPGTRVWSTGYLHGYITTNGQYCNAIAAPMVGTALEEPAEATEEGSLFVLYPNPSTGAFTLYIPGFQQQESTRVLIYGIFGEKLLEQEAPSATCRFSLSGRSSGIYVIRVISSAQSTAKKLIIR